MKVILNNSKLLFNKAKEVVLKSLISTKSQDDRVNISSLMSNISYCDMKIEIEFDTQVANYAKGYALKTQYDYLAIGQENNSVVCKLNAKTYASQSITESTTIKLIFDIYGKKVSINETETQFTDTISSSKPSNTYLLYNVLYGGSKFKYKYIKLYEKNVLIHEFVPAVDFENVPTIYDKVGKAFYYEENGHDLLVE